ncbi:MAG: hypothetical protein ACLSFT_03410 [Ruminococcus callidus]
MRCGGDEDSGHTGFCRLTEPFQAHCIYAKPPFRRRTRRSCCGNIRLLYWFQDSGKRGGVTEKIAAKTMQFRWC